MLRVEGQVTRTVCLCVVLREWWITLVGEAFLAHGVGDGGYRYLALQLGEGVARRERYLGRRILKEEGCYHRREGGGLLSSRGGGRSERR